MHQNWRADIGRTLTPSEEAAHRARIEALRLIREDEEARRRTEAAKKATALWDAAKPSKADHPYLLRKTVQPVANLREVDASSAIAILGYMPKSSNEALTGRVLVAPVFIGDKLSTCELIDGDGRKSAIYGSAKSGGYWAAQTLPDDDSADLVLFIGEGVATMLSVREACGHVCIAALSAGNLLTVSKAMRKRYPAAVLVLVADLVKATGEPDHHAVQAAQAIGGRLLVPSFGDDRKGGETDINDMATRLGLDAVTRAIAAVVQPAVDVPSGDAELPDSTTPASERLASPAIKPMFADSTTYKDGGGTFDVSFAVCSSSAPIKTGTNSRRAGYARPCLSSQRRAMPKAGNGVDCWNGAMTTACGISGPCR